MAEAYIGGLGTMKLVWYALQPGWLARKRVTWGSIVVSAETFGGPINSTHSIAPVAALSSVRLVAQHLGHKRVKDSRRVLKRPTLARRRAGEAVAGQRGHDDVEGRALVGLCREAIENEVGLEKGLRRCQ
jgi:hypothetical protein